MSRFAYSYEEYLRQAAATPFPPTCWQHIEAYRHEEVMEGYLSFNPSDPEPGDNRSSSFRWGWANGSRDRSRTDDGFDALRHEYLRERRKEEVGLDATRES